MVSSKDVLTTYAPNQRGCTNGTVVLAYEKRVSKLDEKALYRVVDTVHVTVRDPSSSLFITNCTGPTNKLATYFVVVGKDALKKKVF